MSAMILQQFVPVLASSTSMVLMILVIAIIIYTTESPTTSFGNLFTGADNKKCQEKYKRDKAFSDPDGNCYMCEEARPDRTIFPVTSDQACEGTIEKIKSAHLKNSKISEEDSKRMFHDPLAETVAFCPKSTNRNLTSIFSDTPCTGICSDLYGPKSFQHGTAGDCFSCEDGSRNANVAGSGKECSRDCEPGYAGDPNGTCFKCPDGTARTLFGHVNSEQACDTFGVPNSGTRAIIGKPWVYPWTSKGSMHQPLKFKESNYSSAQNLGPL